MTEPIPDEPNQHLGEDSRLDPTHGLQARSQIPADEQKLADPSASNDALEGVLSSENELGEQAKEQQRTLRDPD